MLLWCLLPFALLYWFSMASIYIICHVSPSWCIGDIPCQLFVTRRAVLGSQHLCSLTAWAWLALCDWKMDGTFSCATLKMHKAWPCISEASLTMNTQKDKRLHIPDVIKAFVVFQHSTCQTYFMSESYCLIMVIDMLPSLIDAVWYFTVMATIFSFFFLVSALSCIPKWWANVPSGYCTLRSIRAFTSSNITSLWMSLGKMHKWSIEVHGHVFESLQLSQVSNGIDWPKLWMDAGSWIIHHKIQKHSTLHTGKSLRTTILKLIWLLCENEWFFIIDALGSFSEFAKKKFSKVRSQILGSSLFLAFRQMLCQQDGE